MKKLFERFPWLQQAGCGVLVCALLLSICLPLMGMRSAEPENPIPVSYTHLTLPTKLEV